MRRYLLCLFWWAMLLSTCLAQDEEPIFSTEDALTTPETPRRAESPAYPATAYWKITVSIALPKPAAGSHVQMLLPLSDGRQSVLSRRASVTGASYREEADGLNLWGHWFITDAAAAPTQLVYEYTVQIADARSKLPIAPFPPQGIALEWRRYLLSSPLIQSNSARVRSRARQLLRGKTTLGAVAQSLHAYVESLPAASDDGGKEDALSVLTAGRGNRTGKTRALVALLRAVGVPARIVGGIRLGDTTKKRTTISWVEALIGDVWVPMDPAGGHFAWLPNTYLALYRNDLPLLIHTRHAPVEYMFAIRQVTRSEALATEQPTPPSHKRHQTGSRYESEHLHTIAAYVDHPIANVVLINDEAIPQSVVDQIVAAAQDNQINVALLSADIESSSLREHYLQSLISNNMTLIREATLLLIHSRDIDGLYALLKQGETGVQLNNLHIVLAGRFARPTALVLGSVLLRLLKPKELVLAQQEADLSRLWEIARVHLHGRASIAESAAQQHTQAIVLTADTVARLSWWRRCVVGLWTVAVRSQVPLPALNLILALPLIAFFLVIIRNVIGLETFGTFSPMLLSLAFLTTGLGWGLLVFVIIVGLGAGLRLVLQRLRLHLVSRVAILIAVVAVSMVGLTVLGAALGIGALLHASIFPMVIMANTIENFTNTQLERGTGEAFRLTFNTLLVATCSYIGIEETGLKPFVLTFPEMLVGVIIVELLLGRWRGLRLVEYLRFYGVLRQPEAAPATELRRKASVG
ncbi:MAG TPA: 7TM domain-containing protein [Methylomirabilota bacterium]|nr:7TM domain-containing protein [Methylomirabilota bacterium]